MEVARGAFESSGGVFFGVEALPKRPVGGQSLRRRRLGQAIGRWSFYWAGWITSPHPPYVFNFIGADLWRARESQPRA